MKRKEWIDTLVEIFSYAPIRKTIGMRLYFDDEEKAHVKLNFRPDLCHAYGDVHGGIFPLIIDTATWFTAAAKYPNIWIATLELHSYIIRPPKQSSLEAIGELIHSGRRTAIAKADVIDEEGRRIAQGTGIFIVLPELKFDLNEVKQRLSNLYRKFQV